MKKLKSDFLKITRDVLAQQTVGETGIDSFFNKSRFARMGAALLIVIIAAVVPWSGFVKNVFAVERIKTVCNIVACAVVGCDVIWRAIHEVKEKNVRDNTIMSCSAVIAAACGHASAAALALIIFHISRSVLETAIYQGSRGANCFADMIPDSARVVVNDISAMWELSSVQIGTAIRVEAGERIPLDGVIRSGNSKINSCDVFGGTEYRDTVIGDRVYSGEVNVSAPITVEVTASNDDSMLQRMSAIVDSSIKQRTGVVKKAERTSSVIVSAIAVLGIVVSIVVTVVAKLPISELFNRLGMFWAAACPGAAVVALPLIYYIAVGKEANRGVLLKSAAVLDELCEVNRVFFNKTGTLTDGEYRVVGIAANKMSREELLKLVAYIEYGLKHPIARAVRKAVGESKPFSPKDTRSEVPGAGIYAVVSGNDIHIGSKKLMDSIDCQVKSYDSCEIYVAVNHQYAGTIVLEENIRQDANGIPAKLHSAGISEVAIMSSCSEPECKRVADIIGVDSVYSGLRSDEKMACLEQFKDEKGAKLAYVGCDAEDGAAVAYADIGIMQYSTPADLEAKSPDIILVHKNLHNIPSLVRTAKSVHSAFGKNLVFSIALKLVLMLISAFGVCGLWLIMAVDAVAAIFVVTLAERFGGKTNS